MSKKQEKHLQKAREIKARKNPNIKNSQDVLKLINNFIKQIDFESQAKSNNAPNTLNALLSYYKILNESENKGTNENDNIILLLNAIKRDANNINDPIYLKESERNGKRIYKMDLQNNE